MPIRGFWNAAALAAAFFLAGSLPALACACCSWPTQYHRVTETLERHQRDEIARLRFAGDAKLLPREADEEGLPGLPDPEEDWKLAVAQQKDRLVFSLDDGKGNRGTLSFVLPERLVVALIDTRDGGDKGNGPLLYTEWSLRAPYAGDGVFSKAGESGELKLILQGRGNSCTQAETFTHWVLSFGDDGRFRFYGALAAPKP